MKEVKSIIIDTRVWDAIPSRKKSGFVEAGLLWIIGNPDKKILKQIAAIEKLRKSELYQKNNNIY